MGKIDFIQDLKPIFSQQLNQLGYKTKEKYDVETILYHYFNIIFRLPPVQNWTIKQSQELIDKTDSLKPNIKQGLEKFIKNAERGNDLKPWMSENINQADYIDLMFYDWGIYHFHLGTYIVNKGKNKGLIKRTDEVLLAIRSPNESIMYLIDIRPHKQEENLWYKQELIDIIENNWPNILDMYTLPGVVELLNPPSDEDIKILREGQVNKKNQKKKALELYILVFVKGASFRSAIHLYLSLLLAIILSKPVAINPTIQTSRGRNLMSINGGYTNKKTSNIVIINRINFMLYIKQFQKGFINYLQEEALNNLTIAVKYRFLDRFLEEQMKASEILQFFQKKYRKNWDDLEFHLKDITWVENGFGYFHELSFVIIEESSTGVQLTLGKNKVISDS
ncbi:MAG: hypothetical protein AB4062_02020 [Crocosphaera sp.]